jgi:hypothetical protein
MAAVRVNCRDTRSYSAWISFSLDHENCYRSNARDITTR